MSKDVTKELSTVLSDTFGKLKEYFSAGGGVFVVLSAAFSNLTGMQKLMILLLVAVAVDLITGIMAYHYEWKNGGKPPIKGYLIQSSKLRQTYTKGASYLLVIGLVYWVTNLIFTEVTITFGGILKPLSIAEFFTASLIGVEVWSNLENMKRMGVDILGSMMKVISKGWEFFNAAKKGDFKNDKN